MSSIYYFIKKKIISFTIYFTNCLDQQCLNDFNLKENYENIRLLNVENDNTIPIPPPLPTLPLSKISKDKKSKDKKTKSKKSKGNKINKKINFYNDFIIV